MRQIIFLFLFISSSAATYSQVPISQMPTRTGNPNGAWVPIVFGSTNYKTDAANFGWDKMDSAYVRNDSIFGTNKRHSHEFFIGKISTGGAGGGGGISEVVAGYGLLNLDDSTLIADSATLANYFLRRKDSSVTGGYYPYSTNPKNYLVAADIAGKLNSSDTSGHWVYNVYKRNDSFFYAKNGVEVFIGSDEAGTGGDTTITSVVLDSTGQAQHLVLYGAGNNHIGSNAYFHYDSVRHKLVIANKNTSFGGNGIKLGVNGNGYFNGTLKIGAYTLPATDGSSNQVLQTNGSGTVTWQTVSTSGFVSSTLTSAHILVGNGSNVATDVAMTGDIAITNAGVTSIGANKVLDAMIRQSAGLSVIGRSANSTGNVADITGVDHQALRVSGTTLAFGTLDSSYLATGFHTQGYYDLRYLQSLQALTVGTNLQLSSGTTYDGTVAKTISLQNAAADGSTKGAASFNATYFDASSGNISPDLTNGLATSSQAGYASTNQITGTIGAYLNGQGTIVSTGSFGQITIPYNCTITNWYVAAGIGETGTIQLDIKRSGTSIVGAGNKPALSSANSGNAAVSSWTSTSVSAGDILEIIVDSSPAPASLTKCSLVLKVIKSFLLLIAFPASFYSRKRRVAV